MTTMNRMSRTFLLAALFLLPSLLRAQQGGDRFFLREINAAESALRASSQEELSRYRWQWNGTGFSCRNGRGEAGYNSVSVKTLRETKQGECADLSGADLRSAWSVSLVIDMKYVNLRGARLRKADLSRARLVGADLSGADLSGANLIFTDLSGAKLTGIDLEAAHLRDATLDRCDLTHANLAQAQMRRVSLIDAVLSSATLSGADLGGGHLVLADFSYADLSGAKFRSADMTAAVFRHVQAANADFTPLSGGYESNLREADLTGADLTGADLKGAVFNRRTRFPFAESEARSRGARRLPWEVDY